MAVRLAARIQVHDVCILLLDAQAMLDGDTGVPDSILS